MNMDAWIREQIATQNKKAMPLCSFPAVQELFITVEQLVKSSTEMALGVRLIADRYDMPFAITYMDLSVEAEAFGATCTYHPEDVPPITGQLVSDEDEVAALQIPEIGAGRTGYMASVRNNTKGADNWIAGGIPITMMMNIEHRHGQDKPVIRKALVELDGKPFAEFAANRAKWAVETDYVYPGPIQYFGPSEVCDLVTKTLELEKA